jgi:hypothetical protein
VPCGVKAQVATVDEQHIIKIIGKLQRPDTDTVNLRLRSWLQL